MFKYCYFLMLSLFGDFCLAFEYMLIYNNQRVYVMSGKKQSRVDSWIKSNFQGMQERWYK